MSVNYRESTGAATAWRRANSVTLSNPLNNIQAAYVAFGEEDVIQKGDIVVTTPAGGVAVGFDPQGSFPLLNPTDNSVVGSVTHQELYAILYSLYIKAAQDRDNASQGT